ncbi:MAG: hypothetical protein GVY35_09065 [Bacteroidetes bacterium]|jgi:hypothetical protein|nr:hypothetical protein [Bacteroidota bacterium]
MLPGKAMYRAQEAVQQATAPTEPKAKSQEPVAPSTEPSPRPSAQLQDMLNARQDGVNTSLKAMIADAGAELNRQSGMIEDIDRILTAEKARKAYGGAE